MPPDLFEVRRWIEKVDHDLKTAQAALDIEPPVTDTAGFHCQQAAEKLLKAYLFWRDQKFEKIHDLRELSLACVEIDPLFQAWVDRLAPLTAFAVRFRYPGPAGPTIVQIRRALAAVSDLRVFVLGLLPSGLTD